MFVCVCIGVCVCLCVCVVGDHSYCLQCDELITPCVEFRLHSPENPGNLRVSTDCRERSTQFCQGISTLWSISNCFNIRIARNFFLLSPWSLQFIWTDRSYMIYHYPSNVETRRKQEIGAHIRTPNRNLHTFNHRKVDSCVMSSQPWSRELG